MATIISRPASKAYRDNWPFGRNEKVDDPIPITKAKTVFVVARSLNDALRLYADWKAGTAVGYSSIEAARANCKDGQDIWQIDLKITQVRK